MHRAWRELFHVADGHCTFNTYVGNSAPHSCGFCGCGSTQVRKAALSSLPANRASVAA